MNLKKKLYRFLTKTELILKGHIANPLWRSRIQRRKVRNAVQAECVEKYIRKYYLSGLDRIQERPSEKNPDEKIYTIWLQGEQQAPPIVKACFASIRRHCTQELVVLDAGMLDSYITLPEVIRDKYRRKEISAAHFADICRVELLYEYGGIWLDSTDFVTSAIPQWMIDEDFFVYLTGEVCGSPYSFMQNCFIRARKGSFLLECWRRIILDYWMEENGKLDYFQHQIMFKTMVMTDARCRSFFEKMPHVNQDPTHVLWWTIRNAKYSEDSFKNATKDAFFQKTSYKKIGDQSEGTTVYEMLNNPDL